MMASDINIQFTPVPDGTRWEVIIERAVTTLDVASVDHAELNVPHDPGSLDALRAAIETRARELLAEGKTRRVGTPVEEIHVMAWNPEGGASAQQALDYHTERFTPSGSANDTSPQPTHHPQEPRTKSSY